MTIITKSFRAKLFLTILTALFFCAFSRAQDKIQPDALDRLVSAAEKSHSSALVVWQDGQPVGEWHFGKPVGPIEAMSATKSVVNLTIGKLYTDGKIKSVDQPVWEFYPEWKQGRKKDIALRQLLDHTSGLQNFPRADVEVYPSPDFVQLALAAELDSDPGSAFSYNNKAVNLLAGIVQKASGRRMDVYLRDELFAPLGITNFTWSLDSAGNPQVMAGLQILPADFAKLGQLTLNHGKWAGRQLIAGHWFDLSLQPGQQYQPSCGLLWWLMFDHTTFSIDDDQLSAFQDKVSASPSADTNLITRARLVKGRYDNASAYAEALRKAFTKRQLSDPLLESLAKLKPGKVIGWYAEGYLGQFLVVIPGANIVAVRMITSSDHTSSKNDFMDFREMVLKLTGPKK
jgi:CubicO group peptidase (beta-lactamase class C family)